MGDGRLVRPELRTGREGTRREHNTGEGGDAGTDASQGTGPQEQEHEQD